MKRIILSVSGALIVTLAAAHAVIIVQAQGDAPLYAILGFSLGGVTVTPSAGGDYAVVGSTGPDVQQSLVGGDYFLAVGSPVTQERPTMPDEEEPEEEESGPGTLYLPAVGR